MHFYQLITSGSITFPQMGILYHILVIKLVYNKVCQFAYRTKVCGFLRIHRFPPPIKLTVTKLPIGRRKWPITQTNKYSYMERPRPETIYL